MSMKDPYLALGVTKSANPDEIKKAYRKLAKQYHPDVNPGDRAAEERFKEISAAFEIVGDEQRRKLFDEFGPDSLRTGFDPAKAREYRKWSSGQGFRAGAGPSGGAHETFGGFDDIFEQFFYGNKRSSRAPVGRDLETEIDIDFLSAIRGDEIDLKLPWQNNQSMKVRIPPGVQAGERLKFAGLGEVAGSSAGNLFATVKIKPHPWLKREGHHLLMELPLTLPEAILGTTLEVPTPSGAVKLKVPAHTKGGERLRLKGKGVARKGQETGDLYVTLTIKAPDRGELTPELLETLAEHYGPVRAQLKI